MPSNEAAWEAGLCRAASCRPWMAGDSHRGASVAVTAEGREDRLTHWRSMVDGPRDMGHEDFPAHGQIRDVSPARPAY